MLGSVSLFPFLLCIHCTDVPPSQTGEVGKLLGAKWKELDESEKKPYVDQAAKDKERADEEKQAYDVSLSVCGVRPTHTPIFTIHPMLTRSSYRTRKPAAAMTRRTTSRRRLPPSLYPFELFSWSCHSDYIPFTSAFYLA